MKMSSLILGGWAYCRLLSRPSLIFLNDPLLLVDPLGFPSSLAQVNSSFILLALPFSFSRKLIFFLWKIRIRMNSDLQISQESDFS